VSDTQKCKFQRPDGTSCKATSTVSGFCFFHDPDREQERSEARRKGGRSRGRAPAVLPMTAADVQVEDVAGVVSLLGETITQVRKGALDAKIGHVTGYLAGIMLKALEGAELAKQIEEQAKEIAAVKSEMEAWRRERNAQKAAAPATNGTGRAAHGRQAEPVPGSDPRRRRGDLEDGGDDAGLLADIPPFFDQ
jgi:hypothetical protein